ncbi:MAG: hypothetical protein LBG48_03715 [Rickettsiales bacterium]|jgi:hypothetical protein|nr:hypothetical protein [Rickettsiales bacterium]
MNDISTNKLGFDNLVYTLTALPIIAFMQLDGIANDGISWEDVEVATPIIGADGKVAINNKPVVYTGTLNLMATSNSRKAIDNLILLSTPFYGKKAADYELILTEVNNTTKTRTVYAGGQFSNAQSGNNANLDDGQGNKTYQWFFSSKIIIPF